jgi:hypothetical protein
MKLWSMPPISGEWRTSALRNGVLGKPTGQPAMKEDLQLIPAQYSIIVAIFTYSLSIGSRHLRVIVMYAFCNHSKNRVNSRNSSIAA